MDESRSQIHEFLNHGIDAAAFGWMSNGTLFTEQANETDPAQDVVAIGGKAHDEVIR